MAETDRWLIVWDSAIDPGAWKPYNGYLHADRDDALESLSRIRPRMPLYRFGIRSVTYGDVEVVE